MSRHGKLVKEKENAKVQRKRLKNAKKGLSVGEIQSYLTNSPSYMGAIEMSSFNQLVVKANLYSFIVHCKHHFFVIYSSNNMFEIFDSLGFLTIKKCVSPQFLQFLNNQLGLKTLKASQILQPSSSYLCGIYCLFYIIMRDKGLSFEEILRLFSNNRKHNDKFMTHFYNKLRK